MKLERALLFTFAMHALAMASMALLLLPGMPGAGADQATRIHYIATHPWAWRLGWLPWQLTALSDLLLAMALVRTAWIPRLPAWATLLATVAAVIPDQIGQIGWITRGVALAAGDPATYLAYERRIFLWTAAWGATLYTVAALGWTWCFVGARTWNRPLTALSIGLWPLFLTVSVGPLFELAPALVAGGTALGFVALELWLALVTEAVLRRARPTTPTGRWARWRHPRFALLDHLAESRFLRAWGELVPSVALRSDIRDVVYVNYLVAADDLAPLVPPGLTLERLGARGDLAMFTFLSFRHGGFGPDVLGGLRRFLPSPVQSNWRVHVRDAQTGLRGVYFLSSAITATAHALFARWLVDGLPMHVLQSADLGTRGDEHHLHLVPGAGSAPDADAILRVTPTPDDGPWRAAFACWQDMLAYVVPQDRVLVTQPWRGRTSRLEIDLGIPLASCQPLTGAVHSRAARTIAAGADPFSFRVPAVPFRFRGQRSDSAGE